MTMKRVRNPAEGDIHGSPVRMPILTKPNNNRRGSTRHRRRNSSPSLKKLTALKNKSTMTKATSMRPSLLVLSAVWFALCCCLVWKKQQLSQIFFSFVCCFAASGLLHLRIPNKTNTAAISGVVGAITCVAALWACLHHHRPYTALSLVAGYLAFDHWYKALRLKMELSWGVVENAATLSVIVVWLATRHDDDASLLENGAFKVQAWILYKLTALLWLLASALVSSRKRSAPQSLQETSTRVIASPTIPPPVTEELWTIHGVQYDLRDFVSRHPGGQEAILLGQGRDCTALFESYHPFTNQHRVVLQRYRTPTVESKGAARVDQATLVVVSSSPTESSDRDEFYQVLCDRVAQALREKGIDPIRNRAATLQRTLYYIVIVVCVLAAGWAHVRGSWMGSFAFAVFGWLLGALGHDAGHFSASRIPAVNDAGVWAMCLLANPVVWQHQHTYAHHSHTNSFAHDPDLHHFETLLRVHRKFPLRDRYKLQSSAAFVVVAWALVVVGTCFWIPWSVLQSSSLYGMVPLSRPWGLWVHFVAYFGVIMVAPFLSHATAGGAVLAVLTHMFTSGLLFAFFSQINHLNELSLDSSATTANTESSSSWAKAQVETSNNFAPDSYMWHVLSNGLNLQIEHHLFPGLNHCHLHHIAPVVRQTCREHGVQYKSYGTWREIVRVTLDWLDRLSKEP